MNQWSAGAKAVKVALSQQVTPSIRRALKTNFSQLHYQIQRNVEAVKRVQREQLEAYPAGDPKVTPPAPPSSPVSRQLCRPVFRTQRAPSPAPSTRPSTIGEAAFSFLSPRSAKKLQRANRLADRVVAEATRQATDASASTPASSEPSPEDSEVASLSQQMQDSSVKDEGYDSTTESLLRELSDE